MSSGDKNIKEVQQPSDRGTQTATKPDTSDRTILTAKEASDADAARKSPNAPKEADKAVAAESLKGAGERGYTAAGTPQEIYDSVAKTIGKPNQPNVKSPDGKTIEIPTKANEGIYANKDLLGTNKDIKTAETVKLGEVKGDVYSGKKGELGKPGDNSVREIDPKTDNPQAVSERFGKIIDGTNLPPEQKAAMKAEQAERMAKIQEKYKGDDLAHVMRAENLMLDSTNHLGNDKNRINAAAGLESRAINPQNANRQGDNPTCALTSESRLEQQRDFVKYADQMGSVAALGGAWRGGQNGEKPVWVDVDAKGTNHANFTADAESKQMYNKQFHQTDGHRDYLGQLNDAVVGGEMAKYASQRDGKDYVYVSANSQKVDGSAAIGQANAGNTLMERGPNGDLTQSMNGNKPADGPPSSPDMVAKLNNANGTGGIYVQENMANKFRDDKGNLPPGMNSFKDAADLRNQLDKSPQTEFQILTNGTMMAGREGHGLHAQTVQKNAAGQLEFGNNWGDKDNHVTFNDAFVNKVTNPNEWNNYQPQHLNPDGSPDWHKERIGPHTTNTDANTGPRTDDPSKKKADQEKDEADKTNKQKEKNKEEEEQKQKEEKDKKKQDATSAAHQRNIEANNKYEAELAQFEARQKQPGADPSAPRPTKPVEEQP